MHVKTSLYHRLWSIAIICAFPKAQPSSFLFITGTGACTT